MPEEFPDSVTEEAFEHAGGRCECTRLGHGHTRRCTTTFWGRQSMDCRFHHINSFGPPVLSNCEVLCADCHRQTYSWGRPKS